MQAFTYQVRTKMVFGSGKLAEIGPLAKQLGRKGLFVCTKGAWCKQALEKAKALLAKEGIETAVYSGVVPNPTTETIDAGAAMAKDFGADFIIGFGGGSSIDSAKAIAVGASHPGVAWEYRLFQKPITDKVLPVLAVTTTSGTGAEITPVSVVTKTSDHCKFALYDPLLCPRVAIVDPELTLSLPAGVTAATGFDAFCHAFESTIHKAANEFVDLQAHWAMRLVAENLPVALREPANLAAREALALANSVAGICIANVGTTLPHGIGMAIGGSAPHISHGEALAITYPEIARLTWRQARKPYAELTRILNPALASASDADAAERSADELAAFLKRVGLGIGFKDKQVSDAVLDVITEDTFGLPDYTVHPVVVDKPTVRTLLAACVVAK